MDPIRLREIHPLRPASGNVCYSTATIVYTLCGSMALAAFCIIVRI
jgi:hypothetical protein